MISTIKLKKDYIELIDQTLLPGKLIYRKIRTIKEMIRAIKRLEVRGAPAIGVAAAYSLALFCRKYGGSNPGRFEKSFRKAVRELDASRPTAVNLTWATARIVRILEKNREMSINNLKRRIIHEAELIFQEDHEMCRMIGEYGAALIKSGDVFLTHCNAGGLATSGLGTALSVFYAAQSRGKKITVYVDETRPLLQGARLTAWELMKEKIDVCLITDNTAAAAIREKKINGIIVGADRIAANGDTANKIGTFNLAVLAKYFRIPLYIAAPSSTFDLNIRDGKNIPIEERNPDELRFLGKLQIAPKNTAVYNPAFDVTPSRLITAFITEKGVLRRPFKGRIKKKINN